MIAVYSISSSSLDRAGTYSKYHPWCLNLAKTRSQSFCNLSYACLKAHPSCVTTANTTSYPCHFSILPMHTKPIHWLQLIQHPHHSAKCLFVQMWCGVFVFYISRIFRAILAVGRTGIWFAKNRHQVMIMITSIAEHMWRASWLLRKTDDVKMNLIWEPWKLWCRNSDRPTMDMSGENNTSTKNFNF